MHLQEAHPKRRSSWCQQRHQHAHQGACAGLAAEDYFNDKVLEDTDLLYTGMRELPADFWDKHGKGMESWQQARHTPITALHRPAVPSMLVNEFVYQESDGEAPLYAQVKEVSGKTAMLQTLQGLRAQQEQRLGHHGAQSRAEFRAQPADESGHRFRHAARPGRHRQDAADAGRRARCRRSKQGSTPKSS